VRKLGRQFRKVAKMVILLYGRSFRVRPPAGSLLARDMIAEQIAVNDDSCGGK